MATYVIGDVQGCYDPLMRLLEVIHFDPASDTLWFTGDIVNRGPASLAALRFVRQLGERHVTVLGNHDLHLLAVAAHVRIAHESDTLSDILNAEDATDLLQWLRHRPLLWHDEGRHAVMVHAGLAPSWTLSQAKSLAYEVETVLRSENSEILLTNMYGNQPDYWRDELTGMERLRCIINYFTRMRFCHADGRLDLSYKGSIQDKSDDLIPWFDIKSRVNADVDILFGHWAALNGKVDVPHLYALDTGCVWGNQLTALCLEDKRRYSVSCSNLCG